MLYFARYYYETNLNPTENSHLQPPKTDMQITKPHDPINYNI